MIRLALYLVQKSPSVNEVRFRADESDNPAVDTRLFASDADLKKTVDEFMNAKSSAKPTATSKPTPRGPGGPADPQEAQPQQERVGPGPGGGAGRRASTRPCSPTPSSSSPSTSRRCARAAPPTRAPSRGSTRSATRRASKHEAYRLVVSKGLAGEYYGIQGMTWKDPPILDNPDEIRESNGRTLPALLRRPPAAAGRVEDAPRRLLGLQHAVAVAQQAPDARDRRLAHAAQAVSGARYPDAAAHEPFHEQRADRGHRHGLRRPRHRRGLRRARQRRLVHRHRRGQDRGPQAGPHPDLGARPGGARRAPPRPPALLHRPRGRARARAAAVRRRRHAADLLGRRRPLRRPRRRRGDARLRPPRARDEVDRPRRHRRDDQAPVRRAGQGASPTSPAPSSSRRARRSRTSCTRTASSSATTATGPATRSSTSTRRSRRRSCARTSRAPRWSSSPPTPSWPRRSPSSTRSPTCARRPAPTWSRSPRAWASTTASARSSCRPASASAAPASRRTSPRSSSSRATRATTSSCSTR